MKPLPKVKEAISKAAFEVTASRLNGLRPQLREVMPSEFLDHPAYAGGSFPIWWQGQPGSKIFRVEVRPPAFVRFSHHPNITHRGTAIGMSLIQAYSSQAEVATSLMRIVEKVFEVGEVVRSEGFDVTIDGIDLKSAWATRSVFMGPVTISWKVPDTLRT